MFIFICPFRVALMKLVTAVEIYEATIAAAIFIEMIAEITSRKCKQVTIF